MSGPGWAFAGCVLTWMCVCPTRLRGHQLLAEIHLCPLASHPPQYTLLLQRMDARLPAVELCDQQHFAATKAHHRPRAVRAAPRSVLPRSAGALPPLRRCCYALLLSALLQRFETSAYLLACIHTSVCCPRWCHCCRRRRRGRGGDAGVVCEHRLAPGALLAQPVGAAVGCRVQLHALRAAALCTRVACGPTVRPGECHCLQPEHAVVCTCYLLVSWGWMDGEHCPHCRQPLCPACCILLHFADTVRPLASAGPAARDPPPRAPAAAASGRRCRWGAGRCRACGTHGCCRPGCCSGS